MTPLLKRCHRLLRLAIYELPFLAPAATRLWLTETDRVRTLAVTLDGVVGINPTYAGALPDAELAGALAHECLHPLLLHAQRRGGRDLVTADGLSFWNVACDMAINEIVRAARFRLPAGALHVPHALSGAASERIYDELVKDAKKVGGGGASRQGDCCQGCAVLPAGALGERGDKQADGAAGEEDQPEQMDEANWEEAASQARALARGDDAGRAVRAALAPPAPRVRWDRVIRGAALRAVAEHGRDAQTYSRRSRRSPPGVILPGWCAVRAKVAVAIDASGSMGEKERSRAAAECARLQAQVAGLKVYLVVHTVGVHYAGWVNARTADAVGAHLGYSGGTSFEEAYRAVDAAGSFDAVVHLTDGCVGRWPAKPARSRRLVVARVGGGGDPAPTGALDIPVEV